MTRGPGLSGHVEMAPARGVNSGQGGILIRLWRFFFDTCRTHIGVWLLGSK